MKQVLKISALPEPEIYSALHPAFEVLFGRFGFAREQAVNIVVAVEEVFAYCVNLIRSVKSKSRIDISINHDGSHLKIIIEHDGPRGPLEKHLTEDSQKKIERTSFEALGLYIAREVIDELTYTGYWGGKNAFTLIVKFPETAV